MIGQLTICNLRNIKELSIAPAANINLILGENGSGKTSLLEALHILALGRSFRTRSLRNIVQFGKENAQIIAHTDIGVPIGVEYGFKTGLTIRLNRAPLRKLSELAMALPLQIVLANSHLFFEQGPRYRRQLLDWGLFHVEPQFNYHWQSYRKTVQQRNAAIKQHKAKKEIQLWDDSMVLHGEAVTNYRKNYLKELLPEFVNFFYYLCPEFDNSEVSLKYNLGWTKGLSLAEALSLIIDRDIQRGYSQSGSHASDWIFKINNVLPNEILSRGQQKLFILSLSMAQMTLMFKNTKSTKLQSNILLIDDISSELDTAHQQRVIYQLARLSVQTFITSTDLSLQALLPELASSKMFHVKQGEVISER